MISETLENKKTVLKVEKYYKEKELIDRCASIQKNAMYLAEQIKEQRLNNVYIGSIKAEIDELIKTYYELQATTSQLELINELEV